MAFPDCLLRWLAVGVGEGNGSFFAPVWPATWKRPWFWYSWKSLVACPWKGLGHSVRWPSWRQVVACWRRCEFSRFGSISRQSQWECLLFRQLVPCCGLAVAFRRKLECSGGHMRFHADFPLAVEVTRKMPNIAPFTALARLQCEGIGEVLRLPRFYCEEQSLEGIIIYSSNIYFTQQTSNTQGAGCSLVDYILNWTLPICLSI